MLPVVDGGRGQAQAGTLVQDGVEAGEESHVDDQDRNDPDDEDDDDLDDGEAAGLPLARTSRAERFGLGVGDVQVRQDDVLAVALLGANLQTKNSMRHAVNQGASHDQSILVN